MNSIKSLMKALYIKGLIMALKCLHKVHNVRGHRAVKHALVNMGEPSVKPLINSIRNRKAKWVGDYSYETATLIDIGTIAVEPLIEALKDANDDLRCQAAEALGEIRDPRAFKPLMEAFKDRNEYVRGDAAIALGKLGNNKALEPLIIKLNKERESIALWKIITGLGLLRDVRACDTLLQLLKDGDRYVKQYAAEALGRIGDKRAVDTLISVISNTALWELIGVDIVDNYALSHLSKDKHYELLGSVISALGEIGDPIAITHLERIVKRAGDCRKSARYHRTLEVFDDYSKLLNIAKEALEKLKSKDRGKQ